MFRHLLKEKEREHISRLTETYNEMMTSVKKDFVDAERVINQNRLDFEPDWFKDS